VRGRDSATLLKRNASVRASACQTGYASRLSAFFTNRRMVATVNRKETRCSSQGHGLCTHSHAIGHGGRVAMKIPKLLVLAIAGLIFLPTAGADPILFSTGFPNTLIGMASRPASAGLIEIEAADDFLLKTQSTITGGSFWGVVTIPGQSAAITEVVVSFYNIFPTDSTVPPDDKVPTRANSPADDEFASRDTASGGLTFGEGVVTSGLAANSVLNGIN